MMLKRLQFTFILLLLYIPLKAQKNNLTNDHPDFVDYTCIAQLHELVFLHLDRSSIVVGEQLYFKAYIISKIKSQDNKSKILYIELVDHNNKIKANSRSNIDNGICESSITIPDSLTSGMYKIFAYTNLMRNFPSSSYLRTALIIIGLKNDARNKLNDRINNLDSSNIKNIFNNQTNAAFEDTELSNKISLDCKADKQVYYRKEKVTLSLNLKDISSKPLNGSFSISVSEKLPEKYSDLNPDIATALKIYANHNQSSDNFCNTPFQDIHTAAKEYYKWLELAKTNKNIAFSYKSENVDFLLEGTVFDKASRKPVAGKVVLLSTPDSLANLKYSITDSSGKFLIALDKFFDNKKLILNINNDNNLRESYIILENKQISDSANTFEELKTDSITNEFLFKCKKIALINKIYKCTNDQKQSKQQMNSINNFYGKPEYTVRLSDFIELDDFIDISKNILPGVRFRKTKDKYSIVLRDIKINHELWPENCLVLLNNIPFYDYDYLSSLGSKQIERIEVNGKHICYGNLDFYGILSVYTKDKILITNKQSLIFDNKVENPSLKTYEINDSDEKHSFKMPILKQVLFWKPDITFDSTGYAKFEFYTSDLAAEYMVDFEGLTTNGIPVAKKITFVVK